MARGKTEPGPPRRHAPRCRTLGDTAQRPRAAPGTALRNAPPAAAPARSPAPLLASQRFTVRRGAVPAKCRKTRAMPQLSPMYHQLRAHPAIISGESDSRLFYEVKFERFTSLSDN